MSHDHDHNAPAAMVDEISDFEALEIAVREICIEKGLFSAEDHRKFTEFAEHIGPTPAARMVAKAWLDPEYKKLVMTDASPPARMSGLIISTRPDSARRVTTPIYAFWKTRPPYITWLSAPCAPATRVPYSASSRSGIARQTIVVAWFAGRGKSLPSSA